MKLIPVAMIVVLFAGCASVIEKQAAQQNYDNVVKVTDENNQMTKAGGEPDAVKESRYERNRAAVKLAKQIAESASK